MASVVDLDNDDYLNEEEEEEEIKVLIVGETADGKSTLLDSLLDPIYYADHPDERPEKLVRGVGSNANGTTDEITAYRGIKVGDKRLSIYDTPGFGTAQCPVEEIMAKIRAEVDHGTQFKCILTTQPAIICNPSAGAQMARMLIEGGFCGDQINAWNHVILVGTKADKADTSDIDRFNNTLVPNFFEQAPKECKRHSCLTKATNKDDAGNALELDVTGLRDAIADLPDLDTFFFEHHGLTEELLQKVFTKIMGRTVAQAREMTERVKELTSREKELLGSTPGAKKIKEERLEIKERLKAAPPGPVTVDLRSRHDFLYNHTDKRINGGGVRMTLTQLQQEMLDKNLIPPKPPNGRFVRGQGWKFYARPNGTKGDIAWRLYIQAFDNPVKINLQDCELPDPSHPSRSGSSSHLASSSRPAMSPSKTPARKKAPAPAAARTPAALCIPCAKSPFCSNPNRHRGRCNQKKQSNAVSGGAGKKQRTL